MPALAAASCGNIWTNGRKHVCIFLLLLTAHSSTQLSPRPICADLCAQGLGGPPCGAQCIPEPPPSLPQAPASRIVGPRHGVCPFLCRYELGSPFCTCPTLPYYHDSGSVDWEGVCATFCHMENVTVYGCPKCEMDKRLIPALALKPLDFGGPGIVKPSVGEMVGKGHRIMAAFNEEGKIIRKDHPDWQKENSADANKLVVVNPGFMRHYDNGDWDSWCSTMCLQGEGGAACNCDMLP